MNFKYMKQLFWSDSSKTKFLQPYAMFCGTLGYVMDTFDGLMKPMDASE